MNATTINLIAVVILGLVSVAALAALAYGQRKGDETLIGALAPYQSTAEALVARFDTVLAQYGDLLKPVNDLSIAAGTLIDEPTDFAVKLLPDDALALIRYLQKYVESLTDGQPPTAVDSRAGES